MGNSKISKWYLRELIEHQVIGTSGFVAEARVWRAGEKIVQMTSIQVLSLIRMQYLDLTSIIHVDIAVDIGDSSESE